MGLFVQLLSHCRNPILMMPCAYDRLGDSKYQVIHLKTLFSSSPRHRAYTTSLKERIIFHLKMFPLVLTLRTLLFLDLTNAIPSVICLSLRPSYCSNSAEHHSYVTMSVK